MELEISSIQYLLILFYVNKSFSLPHFEFVNVPSFVVEVVSDARCVPVSVNSNPSGRENVPVQTAFCCFQRSKHWGLADFVNLIKILHAMRYLFV